MARQTEVDENGRRTGAQHDVPRGEIAMDNAFAVKKGECRRDASQNGENELGGTGTWTVQDVGQPRPIDEIHGVEGHTIVRSVVVDAHDTRVHRLAKRTNLSPDRIDGPFGVPSDRFEGNAIWYVTAIRSRPPVLVERFEHHTDATVTKRSKQSVVANLAATHARNTGLPDHTPRKIARGVGRRSYQQEAAAAVGKVLLDRRAARSRQGTGDEREERLLTNAAAELARLHLRQLRARRGGGPSICF
jgi:hypothetical protein